MVAHNAAAALGIDLRLYRIAHSDNAAGHFATVQKDLVRILDRIRHDKGIVRTVLDHAAVAYLAAGLGIERGLIQHQCAAVPGAQHVYQLAVRIHNSQHLGITGKVCIAHKVRGRCIDFYAIALPGVCTGVLTGGTGGCFLGSQQGVELIFIHGNALFLQNILGQVQGEAEGVIQLKGVLAGEHIAIQLADIFVQHSQAGVNGLAKGLLLRQNDLFDQLCLIGQLRVRHMILMDHRVAHFIQERFVYAQQSAVAASPTDQTAQHIAPAVVGRNYAVADHKGGGAHMVGNDAQGHILLRVLMIFGTGDLADLLHNVLHGVHFKNIVHILENTGQTLQTHTGINILLLQLRVIAVAVVIELAKHIVPKLYIPVALAAGAAIRRAAAILFATVKINLRAGAAGAGAVLPIVVFLTQTHNVAGINAVLLCPNLESLVVVLINGHIQLVLRHFQHLGAELPSPSGGLFLKIIAKGEVAQHFKEGAVTVRFTHLLNIRGANALLASRHPGSGGCDLAGKVLFHGSHTGVDQQQAVIPLGHQRKAGQPQVALALKERQVLLSQVV